MQLRNALWSLVFLLALSLGSGNSFSQSRLQMKPISAGDTTKTQIDPPEQSLDMMECEGLNNCAHWTFTSLVGTGTWPTGERAVLTVTKHSESEITITRNDIDRQGTRQGLKAVYTGVSQNGWVVGSYTLVYKGKVESGPWYWVPSTPSNTPLSLTVSHLDGSPPVVMSFTTSNPGSIGIGQFSGGSEKIVLDNFDGRTIAISRPGHVHNWPGSGYYTGQLDGTEFTGHVQYFGGGEQPAGPPRPWSGTLGDATTGNDSSRIEPGMTTDQKLMLLHDTVGAAHDALLFFGMF
jgi:hypothetical protein